MSIKELTNEELAEMSGDRYNYGIKAVKAEAELTRRLIESNEGLRKATEENNKATAKYNSTMFDFTIILTFLAAIQIVVSVLPNDMSWPLRIGIAFVPVVVIYVGLKYK